MIEIGVKCQNCKAVIPITYKGAYCPECGALRVRVKGDEE